LPDFIMFINNRTMIIYYHPSRQQFFKPNNQNCPGPVRLLKSFLIMKYTIYLWHNKNLSQFS
jgi:hypothetical protein